MKFSTNIKTYALGISLVLIPSTAKPMHSTAALKIFSKVCTALSWGIAAGPSFYKGAKMVHRLRKDKKVLDQSENESPKVIQFAREVLKERGVPNYQTIIVKKRPGENYSDPFFYGSSSHLNTILIPQGPAAIISNGIYTNKKPTGALLFFPYLNLRQLSELTTYYQNLEDNLRQKAWLEKQRSSPYANQQHVKHALNLCNESLNLHRSFIQHEAAHVVNKGIEKGAIALLVTPLITHVGLKLCAYPLKQLLSNHYKMNILTKGILKILNATLIKYPLNCAMPYVYYKYQEQRADDYVADDLALLKSERYYWKLQTNLWISQKRSQDNTVAWQKNIEKFPVSSELYFATDTDPVHPSYWHRAARFEKRIAKLEQQQQQDATTQQE